MKTSASCGALAAALLTGTLMGCSAPAMQGSAADEKPAAAGTARAALADLQVKRAASQVGYDRVGKFGSPWSDSTSAPGGHNSCGTRDDVLIRDLSGVHFQGKSACVVASGTLLKDPYTGKRIPFVRGQGTSGAIDIDHAVALSAAWRTGAQRLRQADREALANDPLNLIAVSGSANRQKRDQDASTWLPANAAYRCTYVGRQVAVKKKYRLWVIPAEKRAMRRVLASCPVQPLPTETSPGIALKPRSANETLVSAATHRP